MTTTETISPTAQAEVEVLLGDWQNAPAPVLCGCGALWAGGVPGEPCDDCKAEIYAEQAEDDARREIYADPPYVYDFTADYSSR